MYTELNKLLNTLNNIKINKNSINLFFEKYDVLIILIISIKLKSINLWIKSWKLIYYRNKYDKYFDFFNNLKDKGIMNIRDFLDYNKNLYYLIINKDIRTKDVFGDDISFIFSNLDINILINECKKIKIHSNKKTKEFTQETCIESLYFYNANNINNYCDEIKYNKMMKKLCKDTLKYLSKKGQN